MCSPRASDGLWFTETSHDYVFSRLRDSIYLLITVARTDILYNSMTNVHENSVVELHDHDSNMTTTEESSTATSLPAADGGAAAWRLLIAAFVFEALLWGQS